jgi:hypothetical protein
MRRLPKRALGEIAALLLSAAGVARASETQFAAVSYNDGRFIAHTEVLIARPIEEVRAVLTDYENLPAINRGIKTVSILRRGAAGEARMRVVAEACVLVFCRRYTWVQDASLAPSGDIVTVIDPALSDFREGRIRYRLVSQQAAHTRLIFDADLVPDFWLPPLIGPWIVKQKLLTEALETAQGVEQAAGQQRR